MENDRSRAHNATKGKGFLCFQSEQSTKTSVAYLLTVTKLRLPIVKTLDIPLGSLSFLLPQHPREAMTLCARLANTTQIRAPSTAND
jgi:hypothetical protein